MELPAEPDDHASITIAQALLGRLNDRAKAAGVTPQQLIERLLETHQAGDEA